MGPGALWLGMERAMQHRQEVVSLEQEVGELWGCRMTIQSQPEAGGHGEEVLKVMSLLSPPHTLQWPISLRVRTTPFSGPKNPTRSGPGTSLTSSIVCALAQACTHTGMNAHTLICSSHN